MTQSTNDTLTYGEWEARLSELLENKTGVPLDMGEDLPTRDWYDEGLTLTEARDLGLESWGWQKNDVGEWGWF